MIHILGPVQPSDQVLGPLVSLWVPGDFLILVLFTRKLLLACFFQELLLLGFLWGENFCFSEGSRRGFVVLQHYLRFWCKSHLKLEAASSYSISCRAGLCIPQGETWWGFWWNVHPVSTSIQCQGLPSAMLSFSFSFSVSFSIFWLLNSCRALSGSFWDGTSLRAPGSPLAHWHLLFSFPAPGCLLSRFWFFWRTRKFSAATTQTWLPSSSSSWIVILLIYNPENERGR